MNKKQKLEALETAYQTKKRGEDDIQVFNEQNPAYKDVKALQHELHEETGTFELDYSIMSDACDIVSEQELDALENCDWTELADGSVSVYTGIRLSYLCPANEGDITEIVKEYACDIQTACAVWYEQHVANCCERLAQWVLEN